MRYTRLVIEAEPASVSLALHPRLTVIAGVAARVRSVLADELIGGLGSDRSGVHLELADDAGRHLAVFRPSGDMPRVVDVGAGTDVSDEFRGDDGRIDLLAHHGLTVGSAERLLHLDRTKLRTDARRDEIVDRLSMVEQSELWSTAQRVKVTEEELRTLEATDDEGAEDADLIARIERQHQTLESALEQHRRIRRQAAQVSAFSLAAALAVSFVDPAVAALVLAIGLLTILVTFMYRARVEAVERSEAASLADAGADSYLGFVVQRVDGMFTTTERRRQTLAVAADHRNAAVHWTRLAGDVKVEWALDHHEEIMAAARVRGRLRSLEQVRDDGSELDRQSAGLAEALLTNLARLEGAGRDGESLPLVLDDPFTGMASSVRHTLLNLLAERSGGSQVVLMTDDDEVAEWARAEVARTGEVGLVEPTAPAPAEMAI